MRWVRARNRYWAMRGIGAQSTSALEAALWDIVGQSRSQPVWQLLGDGQPRPVLIYASAGDNSLSPAAIQEEARRYARAGYRAYKLRCGGHWGEDDDRLALDAERVAAARAGLGGDRLLFVDVSVPQREEPWPPGPAEAYMEALAPRCAVHRRTGDDLRRREVSGIAAAWPHPHRRRRVVDLPRGVRTLLQAGALGVAQPDAAVVGGPASCVEVLIRARALGIPACLHCFSAGVGIAQNLHAAAAVDDVLALEGPMSAHAPASEPLRPIWRLVDGYLLPPASPGLGVSITDDLLAACGYRQTTSGISSSTAAALGPRRLPAATTNQLQLPGHQTRLTTPFGAESLVPFAVLRTRALDRETDGLHGCRVVTHE